MSHTPHAPYRGRNRNRVPEKPTFGPFPPFLEEPANGFQWYPDRGLGLWFKPEHLGGILVTAGHYTGTPYSSDHPAHIVIAATVDEHATTCLIRGFPDDTTARSFRERLIATIPDQPITDLFAHDAAPAILQGIQDHDTVELASYALTTLAHTIIATWPGLAAYLAHFPHEPTIRCYG